MERLAHLEAIEHAARTIATHIIGYQVSMVTFHTGFERQGNGFSTVTTGRARIWSVRKERAIDKAAQHSRIYVAETIPISLLGVVLPVFEVLVLFLEHDITES
jgi:hypothetical protein